MSSLQHRSIQRPIVGAFVPTKKSYINAVNTDKAEHSENLERHLAQGKITLEYYKSRKG